jgi:SAM-dependent methyltransferase
MALSGVSRLEKLLTTNAPYMSNVVNRARVFGKGWEHGLEETVARIFGDDDTKLDAATKGYVRFSLDATRLQKRFEKTRRYDAKTYEEAGRLVYHNADYMNQMYLPGLLLSQYLWPHQYRQLLFFKEHFVPRLRSACEKRFADVGVGTGFYSRQALAADSAMYGVGFDISEHSLNYAQMQVDAFGFHTRWRHEKRNILVDPPNDRFPFVISVEVLEHLENPLAFIRALKRMLMPGGRGFITAAITAPNEDHIYLYNTWHEVAEQLEAGGFAIVASQEDLAYAPKADEPVPRVAAFIVE